MIVGRRGFVGGALAIGLLPAAAPPTLDTEWSVFTRLAGLFTDLGKALNPIADGITKAKFLRLLRDVDRALVAIVNSKIAVAQALPTAGCGPSGDAALARASGAADKLENQLRTLGGYADLLVTAVKPSTARMAARQISQELRTVGSQKAVWLQRWPFYCQSDAAAQAQLRADLETSTRHVFAAATALDALVAKLD